MKEVDPVSLRDFAITRVKGRIAMLKEQLGREEEHLNMLLIGRSPIINGGRPPFRDYTQQVATTPCLRVIETEQIARPQEGHIWDDWPTLKGGEEQ